MRKETFDRIEKNTQVSGPKSRAFARRFGLCLLGLSALVSAAWAGCASARPAVDEAEDSASWSFSKNIETVEGSRYQAVFLDPDVYGRAAEDLGDVRIVNKAGQFVPYYMDSGSTEARGADRDYALERVARADGAEESTFDFKVVPKTENEDVRGSVLNFDLPGGYFFKKVTVQGSYDGQRWEPAAEDQLYWVSKGKAKTTVVLDNPEKYRYYRLKVPSNTEDLDFLGGTLTDVGIPISGERFLREKELPFNVEAKGRASEVVLYNSDRLRIDRIKVNAAASDGSSGFSRLFYIESASGQAVHPLSPEILNRLELAGEEIDDTEIRLVRPLRSTKAKIVIDNDGNQPLNIRSIEVGYRVDRLVFEDTGTGPYRLVYGSEGQKMPGYDIAAFRPQIEKSKPGEASLGPETAETFTPPGTSVSGRDSDEEPLVGPSDSLRIVFNIVLVVVALLLIVFVGRKLKKGS